MNKQHDVLRNHSDTTSVNQIENLKDYFIVHNGMKFAGRHLIIELWGAENIDNLDVVDDALRQAVDACGATLLHMHLHHFTPNGGITGVAVLAESHISIHTWPERNYAAMDIFMCGDCQPTNALPILQAAFKAKNMYINEQMRGAIYE